MLMLVQGPQLWMIALSHYELVHITYTWKISDQRISKQMEKNEITLEAKWKLKF